MLLPLQALIAEALPPTMTVEDAARLLGISRSTAYTLCTLYRESGGTEGLPNVRFGTRVLVLTAPLLELIRLTPADIADGPSPINLSAAGAAGKTGSDPS